MVHDPELEARILANPHDHAAYAVYGDWLSERGDPRGELVAVQLALAAGATDALRAREAKLLADHAATWLGGLAPLVDAGDVAVTWRNGFLDTIRFGPAVDQYATTAIDLEAAIGTLAGLPNVAPLREILVTGPEGDDYPTSWAPAVAGIAAHPMPAGLVRLELNRGGMWDISSTDLGDLSPAYPRLRRLRELKIELGGMELGDIDLPALEVLEIVTGGLRAENVASIRAGKLPRLRSLLLCIGEPEGDYGCTVTMEDLGWILAGEGLSGVKHLGLANAGFADEIAAALPSSRILRQLETLDLSRGTMSDEGARHILDNAGAFAHLKRLDLTHGFFSEDVFDELEALPGVVVDTEGEEEYRYVAIGE